MASLDEEVRKRCRREDKTVNYSEEYDPKDMVVYHDWRMNCDWIHYEDEIGNANSKYARLVDFFAPVVKDASVTQTTLGITPVKMLCSYRVGQHGGYMFAAPIPEYYEDKGATLSEAVREGTAENASDRMQVAFYLGFCHFREISGARDVFSYGTTQCMTHKYLQLYNVMWAFTTQDTEDIDRNLTLQLNGDSGRCATELNGGAFIDGERQFKIKFLTERFLDPRRKFVIANRLFYCQQLRYRLEKGKISEVVEGVFYPAKAVAATTGGSSTGGSSDENPAIRIELPSGSEVGASVNFYATDEPFTSGGYNMGVFYSDDNGHSPNQLSLSKYADKERCQHFYVYGYLRGDTTGSSLIVSDAKVTKYVNGIKSSVKENVEQGGVPASMLCDSQSLSQLSVGDTLTYVMEADHVTRGHVYGMIEVKVIS